MTTEVALKIPHFSPRELEYIQMRFGREMHMKEIAAAMRISKSWATKIAELVYLKLDINIIVGYGWGRTNMIAATKRLISLGLIKAE